MLSCNSWSGACVCFFFQGLYMCRSPSMVHTRHVNPGFLLSVFENAITNMHDMGQTVQVTCPVTSSNDLRRLVNVFRYLIIHYTYCIVLQGLIHIHIFNIPFPHRWGTWGTDFQNSPVAHCSLSIFRWRKPIRASEPYWEQKARIGICQD